ncbi:MAG: hypothetical protein UX47_C0009G0025 [Candidatus Collierbacteria bacterium GW2011_GWA2_46_26]|uniref:Lipoprotein n=1 Tax=Candidatus Collierbacteria bacterium GW2011_GWA2_46_26 TaxID=1618381 RepID=A0A0G1RRP7_9BACT|nr:MAG: hypothetical protein UX47_C0009G0025 [Candidatus Collierbacteria bacterium GW2011_GWA2_46_26]
MKTPHLLRILLALTILSLALTACGTQKVQYPSLWEIYDPASFTTGSLRTGYNVVVEPIAESELPGYGQKVEGVAIYMVAEVTSAIDTNFSALYVAEVYPSITVPNGYLLSGRKVFFRVRQQANELATADQVWNPIGTDAAAVMSTLCADTAQKTGAASFCPTP